MAHRHVVRFVRLHYLQLRKSSGEFTFVSECDACTGAHGKRVGFRVGESPQCILQCARQSVVPLLRGKCARRSRFSGAHRIRHVSLSRRSVDESSVFSQRIHTFQQRHWLSRFSGHVSRHVCDARGGWHLHALLLVHVRRTGVNIHRIRHQPVYYWAVDHFHARPSGPKRARRSTRNHGHEHRCARRGRVSACFYCTSGCSARGYLVCRRHADRWSKWAVPRRARCAMAQIPACRAWIVSCRIACAHCPAHQQYQAHRGRP